MNDATAACQAEHTCRRGRDIRDYAYLFVGAYVDGGIALNNAVHKGRQGNASVLASLRSIGRNARAIGAVARLISARFILNAALNERGILFARSRDRLAGKRLDIVCNTFGLTL